MLTARTVEIDADVEPTAYALEAACRRQRLEAPTVVSNPHPIRYIDRDGRYAAQRIAELFEMLNALPFEIEINMV